MKNKILIVDSSPDNVQLLKSIILRGSPDQNILEASNGQNAFDLALSESPDLIITDYRDSDSGFDLFKKLKAFPDTRDIPVAICADEMTSSAGVKSALLKGAMEFIRKPYDPIEILARLNSLIAHSNSTKIIKEQNKQLALQKEELALEKEKSEKLLLNILPSWVVEDLKLKNTTTPRKHENVSILFTDFVGFTRLAELHYPEELVGKLDYFFGGFDEIIKSFGLEKIKTIGDAYMCAGGLNDDEKNPTLNTLLAGQAILKFMNKANSEISLPHNVQWNIRIGIHTGVVVSGVVGTDKFAYDLWGDAVNIASRVESLGVVNSVSVSETTFKLTHEFFKFKLEGEYHAKNKGLMKIYTLMGPNP